MAEDGVIKRPRGRPKGSKTKKKDDGLIEFGKEKSLTRDPRALNSPNIIDYDPNDMKQTLAVMNEFRKMGENKISKATELWNKFADYMTFCEKVGFKPTLESFCVSCGVTRMAFSYWKNGKRGGKEMQEVAERISETMAAIDADLAMNNKVYPATYIFRAKNYHDMKDETEVTITPNNPLGETVSAEELEKKYQFLPED